MLPRTEVCPKMMLPVAGEPFAAYQLRWVAGQGIRRVVIAIGHLGEMIEEYVADGSAFSLEISYSGDGDQPLGTGGALRKAVDEHDLRGPVVALYGDSYLTVDVQAAIMSYEEIGAPALMVVYRNEDQIERSNASFDGRLVHYAKHHLDDRATYDCIDYGLSIFDSELVCRLPAGSRIDLADVQFELSRAGRLAGHETVHRFYEIGSASGLADLERHLRSSR